MGYSHYVVTCEGCDFRKHSYTISAEHAIAEVLWYLGIMQWNESTKCPECRRGQLKALTELEANTQTKAPE